MWGFGHAEKSVGRKSQTQQEQREKHQISVFFMDN